MTAIGAAGVSIGYDPLAGAGVHYWALSIDRYGLNACVVSDVVGPTLAFVTADRARHIRLDCSSAYAMKRLVG